jgi:hypothetical protein
MIIMMGVVIKFQMFIYLLTFYLKKLKANYKVSTDKEVKR